MAAWLCSSSVIKNAGYRNDEEESKIQDRKDRETRPRSPNCFDPTIEIVGHTPSAPHTLAEKLAELDSL
jgi:hypothetical protein